MTTEKPAETVYQVEMPPVPEGVWDGAEYTQIHTAVLFLSLSDWALTANTLAPREYDRFINDLHHAVFDVIREAKEYAGDVAEVHLDGERVGLFFYRPSEVEDNYFLDGPMQIMDNDRRQIIERCAAERSRLTFEALKYAVLLKNKWLASEFNVERIQQHHRPWELNIGLHYGWAYLRNRADGKRRIEGAVLNTGKQIESASRQGRYSRVYVSQEFYDVIRASAIKHTQLKQRILFSLCPETTAASPDLPGKVALYELKFTHRLGLRIGEDAVPHFEALFYSDCGSLWAYYQLAEYYALARKDWSKVFELAKKASMVHPLDEKILLDIAQCYYETGDYPQAEKFLHRALDANDEFDLAYEHLAVIASERRETKEQVKYLRSAVQLSPNSAVNNYNLGLALLEDRKQDEGYRFIEEALRIYPDYRHEQSFLESLFLLKKVGKLPALLNYFLEDDPPGNKRSDAEN